MGKLGCDRHDVGNCPECTDDDIGTPKVCPKNETGHEFEPSEHPDVQCVQTDVESGDGYDVHVFVVCIHCSRAGTARFVKIRRGTHVDW